jgi:anti-anti-sigma factor
MTLELLRSGDEIQLSGTFDASQAVKAEEVFDALVESCTVDMKGLDYISSAGLSVLLKTQKRLHDEGAGLRLKNLSPHIADVFRYAGFDMIFEIV